ARAGAGSGVAGNATGGGGRREPWSGQRARRRVPLEELRRDVSLGGVGEDDDDRLPRRVRPGGHLEGGVDGGARGGAGENAFLASEPPRAREGVFVGNRDHFVQDGAV